jgi:hypothetical protein
VTTKKAVHKTKSVRAGTAKTKFTRRGDVKAKRMASPGGLSPALPRNFVGYQLREGGIYVKQDLAPVPTTKLSKGIDKAKAEIQKLLKEFASIMTSEFGVTEIELAVSFSADGKFLGVGIGGAASIKVRIKPMTAA